MSSITSNKKRKLESDPKTKGKSVSRKKFKLSTYHSDSEDDEDQQVTARDAPKSERKIERGSEANATPVATIKGGRSAKEAIKKAEKQKSSKPLDTEKPSKDTKKADQEIPTVLENVPSEEDDEDSGSDLERETDEPDLDDLADTDPSSNSASDSEAESTTKRKTKRHDPSAFANSISAILDSSLSKSKRSDPVLSRSKDAAEVSKALSESKLEAKARKQLVAERRLAKEKGRIRDVLIGDRKAEIVVEDGEAGAEGGMTAAEILAQEKRLRKIATKASVQMFNAIRAGQVRGEEAKKKVRQQGVVGIDKRESIVKEMSKNEFLDLVGAGGERK